MAVYGIEAELKFLKSQIHPHFLFNTLNNLYALTLKKSDLAPDMVLKLSEMLDYMLYHSNEKEVLLKEEIELIRAYLELEKIRYGTRLHLTTTIQGDSNGRYIAPLLLLPFVENSFKHGASSKTDPQIDLFIGINDSFLELNIANTYQEQSVESYTEGIGLKNIQRRLEIQYKDRYELDMSTNDGLFKVEFRLKWNQN